MEGTLVLREGNCYVAQLGLLSNNPVEFQKFPASSVARNGRTKLWNLVEGTPVLREGKQCDVAQLVPASSNPAKFQIFPVGTLATNTWTKSTHRPLWRGHQY